MAYRFPFGEAVRSLTQQDQTPKRVFVLGVYASAVHARWTRNGDQICAALAVASEPRIFWDGDPAEARRIIDAIPIPPELGRLTPAAQYLNGPSAKALDDHILAPLGFTRDDAWLCDCLPETRLNPNQLRVIRERYDPLIEAHGLNPVTIPPASSSFCDDVRAEAITDELLRSQAELLVLLGDIPIAQYLRRVAEVPYASLREYVDLYGYGTPAPVAIRGRTLEVLPVAHPHQISGMGAHSKYWRETHQSWEASLSGSEAENASH